MSYAIDVDLLKGLRGVGRSSIRGAAVATPVRDPDVDYDDKEELPSQEDADREYALPELGDDILDTRLRAAAVHSHLAGDEDDIAGDGTFVPVDAKKDVNKDLNKEENLRHLEDAGLVEHMRVARARLAAAESANTIPDVNALRPRDVAARRALSKLAANLAEQKMAIRCLVDDIVVHGTNAKKIADGERPHGYPGEIDADDGTWKNLMALSKKIAISVDQLDATVTVMSEMERELTLLRRDGEAFADGMVARAAHYEKLCSEFLHEPVAPSETAPAHAPTPAPSPVVISRPRVISIKKPASGRSKLSASGFDDVEPDDIEFDEGDGKL